MLVNHLYSTCRCRNQFKSKLTAPRKDCVNSEWMSNIAPIVDAQVRSPKEKNFVGALYDGDCILGSMDRWSSDLI